MLINAAAEEAAAAVPARLPSFLGYVMDQTLSAVSSAAAAASSSSHACWCGAHSALAQAAAD